MALVLVSLHPFLTKTVRMYTRTDPLIPAVTGTGSVAIVFGLTILCGAAFLHFHFFWAYRYQLVAALGKLISFAAGTLLGAIYFWKLVN